MDSNLSVKLRSNGISSCSFRVQTQHNLHFWTSLQGYKGYKVKSLHIMLIAKNLRVTIL